jgi:hypothetical protein
VLVSGHSVNGRERKVIGMRKPHRRWNWRQVAAFAAFGRFALEVVRIAWEWLNDDGPGPSL